MQQVKTMMVKSAANLHQKELSRAIGRKMTPHLWTGIIEVRPRVGNRKQVAAQLQELTIACSSFCLSGYPHREEAGASAAS